MVLAEVLQRAFAGDGLHAAHARGNAAFFQNLDQPNLAGGRGMRASAQFGGEVANPDHAHLVTILFAEQRHGVILVDGYIDRHILDDFNLSVAQHFLVDEIFNVLQFLVFDRSEMREIEAQMIGRHQRAGLLDVLAQHFAQARVQQVGGGVVAHGSFADLRYQRPHRLCRQHAGCPTLPRLGRVGIS